jgi:hypothetical protein
MKERRQIADFGGSSTMTTLTPPLLGNRFSEFLNAGDDEVEAKKELIGLLQDGRAKIVELHQHLEEVLSNGVEARSFVHSYGPSLSVANDNLAKIRKLLDHLTTAEDAASTNLVNELRLLEHETQSFRDRLAESLSKASEPSRPIDWERIRVSEEAHARGETKPFSRR